MYQFPYPYTVIHRMNYPILVWCRTTDPQRQLCVTIRALDLLDGAVHLRHATVVLGMWLPS